MTLTTIDDQLDKVEENLAELRQALEGAIDEGYTQMIEHLTDEIQDATAEHSRLTTEREYIVGILDTP